MIIEDFRKEISTLYISIAEKDLERFATLLRLFIDFNLRKLLSKEPTKSDLDILGLFDEFQDLGKFLIWLIYQSSDEAINLSLCLLHKTKDK